MFKSYLKIIFLGLLISPVFAWAESVIRIEESAYKDNPQIINQTLDSLHCRQGQGGGYGGTVVLGPGTFELSGPIYLPNNTSLVGTGVGTGGLSTKIERGFTSSEPTVIVGGRSSCKNTDSHPALDNEISEVEIIGPIAASDASAILVTGGQDVRIRHNTIIGHSKGVVLDGGARHSLVNNQLKSQTEIGIQITATQSGISTSHYAEGNKIFDAKVGISIECLETGFITKNEFHNSKTHSISISRLPQSPLVCGGSSIVSGVSIFENQFLAGPQTNDSQIKFRNGYSFPINVSIVDNYFSGSLMRIHAIQADANGTDPNVRSLVVNRNSFENFRKAPLKLGGVLGFNISQNVFNNFSAGASEKGHPEFNSGIYLVGPRAGCGGTTKAGIISNNLFLPSVRFDDPTATGWAILSACMSSESNIAISENSLVDGPDQTFLTGGDIAQTPSTLPPLEELQKIFKTKIGYPGSVILPNYGNVRSVNKCTVYLESVPGRDAAVEINRALKTLVALKTLGQSGGQSRRRVLCLAPGYYWVRSAIYLPSNVTLMGQGANRTQLFREDNYGSTLELENGSNQTVAGILFRHFPDLSSALPAGQLTNRVNPNTAHILVKNSDNVTIEDSWFWRLPFGVRHTGSNSKTIKLIYNYFSGINDFRESGLQEGLAAISLEGSPADTKIAFNFISGTMSAKRQLDWGQGRIVSFGDSSERKYDGVPTYNFAHNNIGYRSGILVSGCKTGLIGFNYIGGLGTYNIEISPIGQVNNLKIKGHYFDGATEAQVILKTGTTVAKNIEIIGNHFFAALNNLYGIRAESRPSTQSVDGLNVLGNTFIDHIANPIKLMGANNFNVNQNIFENFNSLGGMVKNNKNQITDGDYGAAIFLIGNRCGYSTGSGSIKSNLFGGGHFPESAAYASYGVLSACFSPSATNINIKYNSGRMRTDGALIWGDIKGN